MRVVPLLLLFLSLLNCSRAQVSSPAMKDTLAIGPNMIRITGKIISVAGGTATLKVDKVLVTGQGIINVVSEGQKISAEISDGGKKLKTGGSITATLREKLGVDASQSSYIMLQYTSSN